MCWPIPVWSRTRNAASTANDADYELTVGNNPPISIGGGNFSVTLADGQVRNADGETVPGLYAAGRTAASISSPGYSSGTSIGEATFFGRRAGRHAAES